MGEIEDERAVNIIDALVEMGCFQLNYALVVPNKTLYVSQKVEGVPDLNVPLGSSSRYGLQLGMGESIVPKEVYIRPSHRRSAIVATGNYIYDDERFDWIEAKGTGYLVSTVSRKGLLATHPPRSKQNQQETMGLFDREAAFHDKDHEYILRSNGVLTNPIVLITELQFITSNEGIVSVAHAKEQGLIATQMPNPVIALRLCKTPFRLDEFRTREDLETARCIFGIGNNTDSGFTNLSSLVDHEFSLIKEKIKYILKILGRYDPTQSEQMMVVNYIRWWGHNMARNLGIMHRLGYLHRYLHSQNLTPDSSLIDLESMCKMKSQEEGIAEFERAVGDGSGKAVMDRFMHAVAQAYSLHINVPKLIDECKQIYQDVKTENPINPSG